MALTDRAYLAGSAHCRAVWAPPLDADERLSWNRWLKGMSTVIGSVAAVALFLASGGTSRPLEATIQMERLAVKLQQMKAIHPETAQAIASLILQPSYDCDQISCSPAVRARNDTARARLTAILMKGGSEMQAAEGTPTINLSVSQTETRK